MLIKYWVTPDRQIYNVENHGDYQNICKLIDSNWVRLSFDNSTNQLNINSNTIANCHRALKVFAKTKEYHIKELYVDIEERKIQTHLKEELLEFFINKGKIKSLSFS